MEDKGKGTGNIELPAKELGFLSGLGEDTPSRWLTFNGTPGNSTPGTAFGSPFWASLSQVKQHSPSATNPKSYSPSKELNPFELSFFPKQDSSSSHIRPQDGTSIGDIVSVKREDKDDAPDSRRSSLNSSLKRPFQDAAPVSTALNDIPVRDNLNDFPDGPLPSWKRPKFTVDSKQNSSTGTSSDMLGSSPAVGGPSPDAGSPASSIVPTPNLQSAVLPYRKTSLPPDQLEAARLQASLPGAAATITDGTSVSAPYEIHIPPTAAYGAAAANAAFAPIVQKHQPNQLQQPNYPPQLQSYQTGIQYQQGNRFHQPQPQPLILPPKHIQQGQRSGSPYSAIPSSAATSQAPLSAVSNSGINGTSQSLPNPNAIPYANGRPPTAQPTHSSTSIGGTSTGRAGRRAKGKAAEALLEEVDDEDEDRGFYSSTSSAAATKPGKKGKKGNVSAKKEREASILEASSSKRKDRAKNVIVEEPPQQAQEPEPEPEGEEDEEEGKRKAFLERNRQAACRSRQKKKEWINGLESHAANLQAQNTALTTEIENLRKEMFALRHTLSFHERCGCPSISDWVKQNGPAPGLGHHPANSMPTQQQPIAAHPLLAQPPQVQQQAPAPIQHYQPEPMPPAPLPMALANPSGSPPRATSFQPAVQSSMPVAQGTAAPPARNGGVPLLRPQAINLAPQSLMPRPQQPFNIQSSTPSGNDIARPGSAGASFGLSTPNFADLFGSFMNRGNGATPGGLSFSPQLPNTFGLSMQDIPVRPASAPPTPSPALDIRIGGNDYFSSKASLPASNAGSFGDLFASISQNPHSAVVMA